MNIEDIREAVLNDRIVITRHANVEAQADQLSLGELAASVLSGEIIEDYLDDLPYPSCLIHGETADGNPVHSVWGYDADMRQATLITLYRPDPHRWVGWRIRRPRNEEDG